MAVRHRSLLADTVEIPEIRLPGQGERLEEQAEETLRQLVPGRDGQP